MQVYPEKDDEKDIKENLFSVTNGCEVVSDSESNHEGIKKGGGSFFGDILALSGGTVIAQALAILASPIISRLFAPEAFGVAAVFAAIIAIVGPIGCFRYELAIMLPKRDTDAANLFVLCVLLVATITALTTLLVAIGGETFLRLFNANILAPYSWIIPIGVFLTSITSLLTYWNQRHKHFKRIASVRLSSACIGVFIVLITGIVGWRMGINLVLARMVGQLVIPVILAFFWWRYDIGFVLKECSTKLIWQLAKRYKKFPLLTSWTGFIGTATLQAPTLLLAGFFGPIVAGLYSLARRVLSIPVHLVSASVGEIFFQRAASTTANGENISDIVENICCKLITVGLLPLYVIAIIAPDVFGVVFGQRWLQAGSYATILAPCLFTEFVFAPLAVLFFVFERQGADLSIRIVTSALTIGALVLGGIVFRDAILTLVIFSVVTSLGNLWRLSYLLKAAKARGLKIFRHFLYFLIIATLAAVAYGTCKWLLDLPLVLCLLVVTVSSIPYAVVALRRDEQLREALFKVIGKVWR